MLEERAANYKMERGGGIRREEEGMDGGARREFCTKKHYHNCHI